MIPVSLTAFSAESGTTLIPKVQASINLNACFIVDFTTFSPTEVSITFEGDSPDIQKTIIVLKELGIKFTENSEFEIRSAVKRAGEVTVVLYLVTGKKKDLGNILDERFEV